MSLTFTLRRVLLHPLPAAQSLHQSNTRGGAVELDPTTLPAAADDNENPMSSQLKSDHGDHEFEEEEEEEEEEEGIPEVWLYSPQRDAGDDTMHSLSRGNSIEYEEYLMSTGAREYDVDQHSESDDDTMRSLRQGDDESEEDLMSTGASEYYMSSLTERDDAAVIYDDMMRSIRGGDSDSMATPQSEEGLPEEVIETFLKTTTAACDREAADGGVCAVCLDDLYEGDRAVGVLPCRHGFHGDCIGDWLRMKNDCPLCRAIAIKIDFVEE